MQAACRAVAIQAGRESHETSRIQFQWMFSGQSKQAPMLTSSPVSLSTP